MEKHEKIQFVEDFLAIMEKTHQMEIDNKAIPSIANQYKYKKEELFDNFILSIIELMPLDKMNFFGNLRLFLLILREQQKLSIHQELSFDKFLARVFKNAENAYNKENADAKQIAQLNLVSELRKTAEISNTAAQNFQDLFQ